MKIGLLIIDMQNQCRKHMVNTIAFEKTIENINYVANLLRTYGHYVIQIQDIEGVDNLEDENIKILPEIEQQDTDLYIKKTNSNSFWKTDLEKILIDHKIDYLIISGFAAEHCVIFTYQGALERGYNSAILKDGILSAYEDVILTTYRDREIISYSVIESFIQNIH